MKRPLDAARELLELAREDLVAGSATLDTGDALRTVCFHAQQAAEKSIKGLLSARDLDYPWRHDLKALVRLGLAPVLRQRIANVVTALGHHLACLHEVSPGFEGKDD